MTTLRFLHGQRRLAVGVIAQALQYGAALLLLPFLAATLSAAEIGIWYLLITMQGLAAIADFGFGGAFARSITTALAGAGSITSQGFAGETGSAPNRELAGRIVRAARVWYAILGVSVFALLMSAGLAYVLWVSADTQLEPYRVGVTWSVMAFGTGLSLYFSWINPVLIGANRIEQDLISLIVGRGGAALLGVLVLLAGGGLFALALAQLVALAAARLMAGAFLRPIIRTFPAVAHDWHETRALLRTIAPNAARSGLSSLSGFLITRSSVFAVTTFVGLAAGGRYAISLQLFSAVLQVSQLPSQFTLPRFVELQARCAKSELRYEALRVSGLFVAAFCLGIAAVVCLGPWLFAAIGKDADLLPRPLLLLLGVVMMLEGLHHISAFVLMTGNKVPFARAAVLSALVVVAGVIIAGRQGWGVLGIIAVQGLVQLSYNNWRWPLMVLQDTRAEPQPDGTSCDSR